MSKIVLSETCFHASPTLCDVISYHIMSYYLLWASAPTPLPLYFLYYYWSSFSYEFHDRIKYFESLLHSKDIYYFFQFKFFIFVTKSCILVIRKFLFSFFPRLGPKFLLKISLQNGGTHPVVQVNIFISKGVFDLLFPFCSLLTILLLYCHLWHFLIILSKFKLFRRIITCISYFNMILQVILFLFYF